MEKRTVILQGPTYEYEIEVRVTGRALSPDGQPEVTANEGKLARLCELVLGQEIKVVAKGE